jgi:CarboxypepD_reg-like domain
MKSLLLIALIVSYKLLVAQVTIKGIVTDSNGKAIPGANVLIAESYDGTSSDNEGRFEFTTLEKGNQILLVRFVGFKESAIALDITDDVIELNVNLLEEISELQAVTITAGAFTASDVSRRTVFRALDIATTAGATADIAGALNTLPGTQKVAETGRLFVRGGDSNEARTFIDGLVVLDAYSPSAPNTPSRGRFLPFMFKGTSFSTGGYSAEYGQALSSALVLDSRDKAELQRTDFGILSVGGDFGHTQVWDRGSIGGKLQYTNLKPYTAIIRQETDWVDAPISFEGGVALRQQVGQSGLLKFYGNFNRSTFSLYQHDIDDYYKTYLLGLTNTYRYLNGSYKSTLNDNWSLKGGVSYTNLDNETVSDTSENRQSTNGVHVKAVTEGSVSDKVELKAGIETLVTNYRESSLRGEHLYSFEEIISSLFLETDIYFSNQFVVRIGSRVEHNALIDKFSVDPRISLAHKLGSQGQLSLAYGKFRQSVKTDFLKMNADLRSEKADHFILNYQVIKDNKTFRVESFYKHYRNLVKFGNTIDSPAGNEGRGDAKGFELFWRDNASIRSLDYWISYSFLDTKRDYLDYPVEATPSFASKHNFSIVAKYFVKEIKSQLGLTYSFTSGRPYNNPNAGTFNGMRTPNYSDLSFNWSYLPTTSVIIYWSCTNLLGRDNIFGYEYSTVQNQDGIFNGRPIRQAAPRFLFIGIFITISKDKTVNQLPNL